MKTPTRNSTTPKPKNNRLAPRGFLVDGSVGAEGGSHGAAIPYAARYLFTAVKLVAPQALLGVMVSEWLLSGRGLGNLLNVSRGSLDYDMIWAGAVASILVSVFAYEAVSAVETLWGRTR